MREDMYRVIVERPRYLKEGDATAARLRNDFDGPSRLGTRAGYGYRRLNENLTPLRRYLHAQTGRPWNKVFSEICASIDRRNTVQQHVHEHIRGFIAIDVGVRDGRLIDLENRLGRDSEISQELYVDPRMGLIRSNKDYRSWRHGFAERCRREQAEIEKRRRKVDERVFLLLLDNAWFRVDVDVLPKGHWVEKVVNGKTRGHLVAEPRYDVVLRRSISQAMESELQQCKHLYGSEELYAVSKRQISAREIKAHRLR